MKDSEHPGPGGEVAASAREGERGGGGVDSGTVQGSEREAVPDGASEQDPPPAGPPQPAEGPSQTPATSPPLPPGFVDRRRRPTPMLSRYSFFGGRRGHGKEAHYVDLYPLRTAVVVLMFFALTVFDAVATVYYIDHAHGTEANPIAQWMLDRGRVFFVFAKGVPTMLLLLFVLLHKNFRYGRTALGIGFGFYFLLTGYHLVLQYLAYLRALPVGGG